MKIAVTAASGSLGKAIVRELLKRKPAEEVVGIARTVENAENLGVEIRKGDYNEKADFLAALQDIDRLLIVSGMDVPEKRAPQHKGIIDAARESGVAKVVYTSIIGAEEGNAFSPIVASNRQTESDLWESGLDWVIGRNGIYIEPDMEHLDVYKKEGKIANCASEGKCSYTLRGELAYAYAEMLLGDEHNGNVYNLAGAAITQQELVNLFNKYFGTSLVYGSMSVKDFTAARKAELGEFMGTIIGGIYAGISTGDMEVESDFTKAAGREHVSWGDYFRNAARSKTPSRF